MKNIPYSRQSINEADVEAVCSVLHSDWLTQGPRARELEESMARQCGARHCIMVSNGTMALHMACLALDLVPGDAGLTSPISFLASANCIAYCGGRPDFADIDPKTLCISPEKVEEYCENHPVPRVVIPVDFAGVPADLPQLKRLSEKYGFKLIEDAAHAIGSVYIHGGERYACGSCTHTDMAILSFHPVKSMTAGEGGAVLTNNDSLADKLRYLVNHGVERNPSKFINLQSSIFNCQSPPPWYYEMQYLGFNGRITDLQAALGLSQLKRLKEFKAKRQDIARKYNLAFKELAERNIVILPPWPEWSDPCFHIYVLSLGPDCRIGRDDLFLGLREKGIYCQVHYIPIYRQPFYARQYNFNPALFPESEKYFKSCISMPLFPDMDDEIFQYIIKSFHDFI